MEQLNKKTRQSYSDYSGPEEYAVSFIPRKEGTYIIEIDDVIQHVSQFRTAIQVLDNANEEDDVVIKFMCCPGGSVDAGDSFLHSLRQTQAHVKMVASGGNHSMATHILLEADELELSNGFHALIHCGTTGAYGNVNEYHAQVKFDMEFRTRQFREAYEGFLTDAEIDGVLKGSDIWVDGQGWMDRAHTRAKYFQAKFEKMQREANKASKPQRKKLAKLVPPKTIDIVIDKE